ncbi:amino acid adenylation domain-containing protein [Micromonospora sp. NPDC050980]|uniref:amino acid adenylation domain-containing protein n=1 Tax=Micromonospora sp. NPDC050980 TaxID=3155161 RepID=UPI0033C243F2
MHPRYADTLHDTFTAAARRHPDAVALSGDGATTTYAELAARAAPLTARLRAAGVAAGEPVALRVGRGPDAVVGILGILGAGGAYVPVDPAYPEARQAFLLADTAARHSVIRDGTGLRVVTRDGGPPPRALPPGTAYVIHTSGSTGQPKGVMVGHRQVLALFAACVPLFEVDDRDVWSVFHSTSFDFSVWEIWGALLHGGRAVIVPESAAYDPGRLLALLARERVTVCSQVPTPFRYLVDAARRQGTVLPALRHLVLGGEPADLAVVADWRRQGHAPRCRVSNMYGITETTVHVTHTFLTGDEAPPLPGATPIGRPLPHLAVELVNEDRRPVPDGTPGEMVVHGAGVAHGYLGNAALTAARFPGGDRYRSGDWAVRATDGTLYHLGRRDDQVQVRGYRVELGEVAAAVRGHPAVNACVVTAPTRGEARILVAHVQLAAGMPASAADLRAHTAAVLPAHLVPSRFVAHEAFPVTASGKVDRSALDAPEAARR